VTWWIATFGPSQCSASTPRAGIPRGGKTTMAALRRALDAFRGLAEPLERYVFLRRLQRSETETFYRALVSKPLELMPFVYTPTVGEACERYHELGTPVNGVYITADDAGRVGAKLRRHWKEEMAWLSEGCGGASAAARRRGADHGDESVAVAVVTDGERILGLGDLGAGGMGISEGKILLYTVCAGVHPATCLPVCLDVGTNNERLLNDPNYKGLRRRRLTGEAYDALVDEFMRELRAWQPRCLVQFEDFGNANAFRILEKYRHTGPCFNDDIQGTASITLAALLSALRVTKGRLEDQRILFYGAGEAGVGIGELIAMAMEKTGMSHKEAMERCYFMDSKGLVCKSRLDGLQPHKVAFAHDVEYQPDLLSAINAIKPTALIGVSTIGGAFTEDVVKRMCDNNARPIIFPLSNPTSKSECTFEQAMDWSNGKVVFASGSPFDPVVRKSDGTTVFPAQANNAYVFPALGYAAALTGASQVTDDLFLAAAESLSNITSDAEIDAGHLFPDMDSIRSVSVTLTAEICEMIVKQGLGTAPAGVSTHEQWLSYIASHQYDPGMEKPMSKL
jgi:malate dehydrogenase (oxaloacetate-decarboxylating)(NADP+)